MSSAARRRSQNVAKKKTGKKRRKVAAATADGGKSRSKVKKINTALTRLRKNAAVAALLDGLPDGVQFKITAENDTRYDRASSTIQIYSQKKGDELVAAVLFEANNADNPLLYTTDVESVLTQMSRDGKTLSSRDFINVARQMEKDEFISLINYHEQVKALYNVIPPKIMAKLEASLVDGELSYSKFVDQNRSSGHTVELARAQFANFTGESPGDFHVPLRISNPTAVANLKSGTGSQRGRDKTQALLADEVRAGVDVESAELSNLLAFDEARPQQQVVLHEQQKQAAIAAAAAVQAEALAVQQQLALDRQALLLVARVPAPSGKSKRKRVSSESSTE
jgi:hypothetical protein